MDLVEALLLLLSSFYYFFPFVMMIFPLVVSVSKNTFIKFHPLEATSYKRGFFLHKRNALGRFLYY